MRWHRKKKPLKESQNICIICKVLFTPSRFHPNATTCSKSCLWKKDYEKNKERYKKVALDWGRANRDKTRIIQKNYYWNNVEKVRTQKRVRNRGHISLKDWKIICDQKDNKCQHCFLKGDHKSLSIDHIIPISKGGTNVKENLQPLCLSCNHKKGNRFIG